jgi:hypothetical protein
MGYAPYLDNEKVLFYINGTYAAGKDNEDSASEKVLTYVPVSAGFEYRHQVYTLPLYITGTAGAGVSYFEKEIKTSETRIHSAFGPYYSVMIGLNYVLSQHIALFAQTGYQASVYNNDEIDSPAGIQFRMGVRIPISGSHRSFD